MTTLNDLLNKPIPEAVPKTMNDLLGMEPPKTSTDFGQGFWKSTLENPRRKVPFLGSAIHAAEMLQVIDATSRLNTKDYNYREPTREASMGFGAQAHRPAAYSTKERDREVVERYLTEVNKEYTGAGKVGRIVGEMPAFMIEFLATGGLKKLGEKGVIKIAEKLLKGQAKNLVAKATIGTAKYATGAALRSVGLPQRAAVSVLKRQLPTGISYGPNGEIKVKDSGEAPLTSIIKGLGDHYIEVLSEQAGEIVGPAMGKALIRTPFLGKVLGKAQAKWLKLHKNHTTLDFISKISTRAGFDGMISELGEEFYGNQLRAIFNIDDFGAGKGAGFLERMNGALESDLKNLPYMAIAFALPGAGKAVAGFAADSVSEPINIQGSNIVSEAKHEWTPEEVNKTFGGNIFEALESVSNGDMTVDEVVEMSENNEVMERREQELPTINDQNVEESVWQKKVDTMTQELIEDGVPEDRARAWAEKVVVSELEEEEGTKQIISERAEPQVNVYKTTSGSRTGITEQEVIREGDKYVDSVTGEEVILDIEASSSGRSDAPKSKAAAESEEQKEQTKKEGRIEFFERKKFDNPKTTVVKELAKLISVGLSLNDAISTLQDLRTPATQEVTYKDAIDKEVNEIVAGLAKANPDAFNAKVIGSRKSRTTEIKDVVKDTITHYHWGMARIGRMIEWLDGGTNGSLKEYIWKPIRAAVAQSALGRSYRMKQLNDFLASKDINIRELYNKRIEIRPDLKLRPVDMLEIFLATKDADKLKNLKEGNKLSDEDIQLVLSEFIQDEKLVEMGRWLLEQYSSDYDEIADKYFKTTGTALPKIKGYSGIRKLPEGRIARFVNAEEEFDDLITQLLGEVAEPKLGLVKTMTKERTKGIGALNLDALSNYVAHARTVEHYKAMALPVYNVNKVIKNKNFRKIIQEKTRGAGNKILDKWLQDVTSERTSLENDWLSRTVGILRRNSVVSALGLNIVTALKQPLSMSLALAEDPRMIPYAMAAFAEGARNPKALKDFVHGKSVVVKHRNMEREIREMARRRSVRQQIGGKRALSEKALFFVRLLDQATVTTAWKAAYDMKMKSVSEADAITYADSVIERTQPMADIMDLPHFFRGGELSKLFTLFQNQINQNYNYWSHDILGATKRGEISPGLAAYRVLMSYILPATVLGLINRGFTPPDPEDWAKDMASFAAAPLFVFGKIISAVLNGYDPSSTVGFGWAKELYDASTSTKDGEFDYAGAGVHLAGAAARAGGIPWSQPKRTIKGIMELNSLDTRDPRRLIWSSYALGEEPPSSGSRGSGRGSGRKRGR